MTKLSAANIRIKRPDSLDLIGGLRKLLDGFDADVDLHDWVDAVIAACLWQGIATRSEIIAVTDRLGFTRGHTPIRLAKMTGLRWRLDATGRYSLTA